MKSHAGEKLTQTAIDASGESLGRLAVRIADTLRGKDSPAFSPNRIPHLLVVVTNADKLTVNPKKIKEKIYRRHSGYPGGLSEETLGELMERDSREVLRRAVYGMLPRNKLRDRLITNLRLYRGEKK